MSNLPPIEWFLRAGKQIRPDLSKFRQHKKEILAEFPFMQGYIGESS